MTRSKDTDSPRPATALGGARLMLFSANADVLFRQIMSDPITRKLLERKTVLKQKERKSLTHPNAYPSKEKLRFKL
jgi:hypothetical protein